MHRLYPNLISMGKLIKEGWKFTFEMSELIAWTTSGHKISCTLGDDNVIRIPHGIRTGKESVELPIPVGHGNYSIGTVSNSKESASGKWLHAYEGPATKSGLRNPLIEIIFIGLSCGVDQCGFN